MGWRERTAQEARIRERARTLGDYRGEGGNVRDLKTRMRIINKDVKASM